MLQSALACKLACILSCKLACILSCILACILYNGLGTVLSYRPVSVYEEIKPFWCHPVELDCAAGPTGSAKHGIPVYNISETD